MVFEVGGNYGEMRSWRWGPRGGKSILKTRDPREIAVSLSLPCCEDTARCKTGRGPSPGTKLANTLMLECPASKTVRNKCLLLKPLPTNPV